MCALTFAVSYALQLINSPGLMSIDLSSLEEIRGGGLQYALNSQLCYVGNLPSYLTNPETQLQCIRDERRNPSECSKFCHNDCCNDLHQT